MIEGKPDKLQTSPLLLFPDKLLAEISRSANTLVCFPPGVDTQPSSGVVLV